MRSSDVLLVAVVAALTACSPAPPTPSPSAVLPTAEPASAPPSATLVPEGTLVVQQSTIEGGFYTEGAFAYVEVTDQGGTQIARVEDPEYHLAKELARVELPPGRYVIGTYVRPCEAACPALDGPSDRCELSVNVVAAGIVLVQIERRVGRPCAASVVGS